MPLVDNDQFETKYPKTKTESKTANEAQRTLQRATVQKKLILRVLI